MKILNIIEYFHPFSHGGSEQSVYIQSKKLIDKGFDVYVYTANFGANKFQKFEKINIIRFPLIFRQFNSRFKPQTPIVFTNIFQQILIIYHLLFYVYKNNIDILHVQSSYLITASFIVSFLTRKRLVVTLRDYQVLCPLGLCINEKNKYHACNFWEYYKNDMRNYLPRYFPKTNALQRILIIITSYYGKIFSKVSQIALKNTAYIICISKKQQQIFKINGLFNTKVVYNSSNRFSTKRNKKNQIVFVGRLTFGKGIHLLVESFDLIHKKYKTLKLLIVGDGVLRKQIIKDIKHKKLDKYIKLVGQKNYKQTQAIISESKLAVIPSIWEEPFGRVALESVMNKTPIVVTNNGALPEIVKLTSGGYLTKAEKKELARTIVKALQNNDKLISQIKENQENIDTYFNKIPINTLVNLYKTL